MSNEQILYMYSCICFIFFIGVFHNITYRLPLQFLWWIWCLGSVCSSLKSQLKALENDKVLTKCFTVSTFLALMNNYSVVTPAFVLLVHWIVPLHHIGPTSPFLWWLGCLSGICLCCSFCLCLCFWFCFLTLSCIINSMWGSTCTTNTQWPN